MKVFYRWTSMLFVMAVLCLTLNADNKESTCQIEIKVQRHTNHNATVGQSLKIECPVSFCDSSTPTVKWFKYITKDYTSVNISDCVNTQWKNTSDHEGIFSLFIKNVQRNDEGHYQCRSGNVVGHAIIVRVKEVTVGANATLQDQTNTTSTPSDNNNRHMWLYVYTTVGIVGFVTIVTVISVLSMRGCNGTPKNKAEHENQYMDIPMVEQPVHHSGHQTRASLRGPPSHRTSRKNKPSPAPPHSDNVYGQMEADRDRTGPEAEWSSVVYAALNHQHLVTASPRPRAVTEEQSEYAAIKVS